MSEYIDRDVAKEAFWDSPMTDFGMNGDGYTEYDVERILDEVPKASVVSLFEYEKVVRERDAIIEYIKNYHECTECKWENALVTDEPCRSCKFGCGRDDRWEWRGAQEVQYDAKRKVD